MDVKALIGEVKKSEEFKKFIEEQKNSTLAHAFIMTNQDDNVIDKQVGFYNHDIKRIISFTFENNTIKRMQEAEVFRKEKTAIKELKLSEVATTFDEINKKATAFLKEKYKSTPSRKIFILQHLDVGQVWNITFLTNRLSTVNIKVDAATEEIISDEEVQIMDFKQSQ